MNTIRLTKSQIAQLTVNEKRASYKTNPIIDSPSKVYEQVKYYGRLNQEHFVVMTLDSANRMIDLHEVTVGTLTASLVHPREVFKPAIDDVAASIIVIHNHPSGSLTPSTADLQVTQRLEEVGDLIGIKLNDHLIVTEDSFASII